MKKYAPDATQTGIEKRPAKMDHTGDIPVACLNFRQPSYSFLIPLATDSSPQNIRR
jgi:hypothetical protein